MPLRVTRGFEPWIAVGYKKGPAFGGAFCVYGGERGIRTLDGLLTHTPLAGERLQPLGHLSVIYDFTLI